LIAWYPLHEEPFELFENIMYRKKVVVEVSIFGKEMIKG